MAGVELSLAGRVALITGGSRGIGAETVRMFAEAGARVVFSYRQARAQAQALMAACGGPERCVAVEQELSTPAEGRALVRTAVEAFGRLDALVVNHGVWPAEVAGIERITEEQWRRTIAVNLDSVFGLVQGAVAQMELQGPAATGGDAAGVGNAAWVGNETGFGSGVRGHIVLISSTAGQRGEAGHADYAVTKGALISLTKSLSSELAPRGILVNCVAPGWVATEMSAAALDDAEMGPRIAAGIPVGRVGRAREIAGPVLFLCTPLAGFMSGEVVNVNGGAVLAG
ncbi:MAG: SDR family NAD(P)-dependent oxidoreductase [Terriglobales bacterium]